MILPAKPEALTRTEIKAVFRRHWGSKARLASDMRLDLRRLSDWFGKRYQSVDSAIVVAIRQRAADLINAERAKASGEQA